jgi:tryptophan-rich sensory protein
MKKSLSIILVLIMLLTTVLPVSAVETIGAGPDLDTMKQVLLVILMVLAVAYFIGLLWMERLAAFFFLPYLLWLFFAVYLNTYMLIFN